MTISVNCTTPAITTINDSVRKYCKPFGMSKYSFIAQLVMLPIVNTNAVAAAMPMEASSFLETPINGHKPKILTSTMLLTNTVPIKIIKNW